MEGSNCGRIMSMFHKRAVLALIMGIHGCENVANTGFIGWVMRRIVCLNTLIQNIKFQKT